MDLRKKKRLSHVISHYHGVEVEEKKEKDLTSPAFTLLIFKTRAGDP